MANSLESVSVFWSATDEQFFRVAAELFSPNFLCGAGVLLASYDADPAPALAGSSPIPSAAERAAAGVIA